MSAVDVLAVMDAAAYELHDYTTGSTQAQPLSEARAAVAELIEALADLEALAERYRPPGAPIPDAQKKARAARARVGGAK